MLLFDQEKPVGQDFSITWTTFTQCCFLSVNCRLTIGNSRSRTSNQSCRLNHNRSRFLNIILFKIGMRENCAIISQGLSSQQNYLTYSHGANTSRTPPMMFSTSVPAFRKPVLSLKIISDMTSAEKYPSHSMKLTTSSGPSFPANLVRNFSKKSGIVPSTQGSYLII